MPDEQRPQQIIMVQQKSSGFNALMWVLAICVLLGLLFVLGLFSGLSLCCLGLGGSATSIGLAISTLFSNSSAF